MSHPMDDYIRQRVVIDAEYTLSLAQHQKSVEHKGLRGRYRELLMDRILQPWLPPSVRCSTGTVVSMRNFFREKTQEDILLIDQDLSPSVLMTSSADEGVFMRNSVLARIEVKSTLTSEAVREFSKSCDEFSELGLDVTDEQMILGAINMPEINMLFAYKSSVSKQTICSWLKELPPKQISAVCVADQGFWKRGRDDTWWEYSIPANSKNPAAERLAAFVGLVSNTAFNQHVRALGRDPDSTLEGGIGQHFNNWQHAA